MRRRIVAIGLLFILCSTQGIMLRAHGHAADNAFLSLEASSAEHSEASLTEFVAPGQWLQQKASGVLKLSLPPVYLAQTFSISHHLFLTASRLSHPDTEDRWKSHLISLLYPAHEFS